MKIVAVRIVRSELVTTENNPGHESRLKMCQLDRLVEDLETRGWGGPPMQIPETNSMRPLQGLRRLVMRLWRRRRAPAALGIAPVAQAR